MYKRKIQIGYDKKLKQPIYKELTYEFFSEHVDYEYWFKYYDKSIDIAHFYDKKKQKEIYHISVNDLDDLECKNGQHQEFESTQELLENGRIDGKTLKDIWEELEN